MQDEQRIESDEIMKSNVNEPINQKPVLKTFFCN